MVRACWLAGFLIALAACEAHPLSLTHAGTTTELPASCDLIDATASGALGDALAAADRSCATDADCAFYDRSPYCAVSCGGEVLSLAGVAAVDSELSRIESAVCVSECREPYPPCPLQRQWAACVDATCTSFPPEAWQTIALEQVEAPAGSSSAPLTCTTAGCTLWTVSPDATITIVRRGATSSSAMSTTDFATVDGILRSMAFRQWEDAGYRLDCPGDTTAQPQLDLGVQTAAFYVGMNVTGCVFAGAGVEDALATLVGVITAY